MEKSVLKTLAFFDIFEYPLNFCELHKFLWKKKCKKNELKKIIKKKKYYYLKKRENLVNLRKIKEKCFPSFLRRIKFYLYFLRFVPFIKMAGICNNMPVINTDKNSDIDLLIITARNRLWTARVLTTALLHILGVRRYGNKIKRRFCLSFYLTEDTINLNKIAIKPADVYLTYWIATIKPIIDSGMYKKFIQENRALLKNIPNFKFNSVPVVFRPSIVSKMFVPLGIFEKLLKKILILRSRKKAKIKNIENHVIIKKDILKFYYPDRRKKYLEEWNKKYLDFFTAQK